MTTTYPTQASSTFSVTFGGDLDEEFDAPAASAMSVAQVFSFEFDTLFDRSTFPTRVAHLNLSPINFASRHWKRRTRDFHVIMWHPLVEGRILSQSARENWAA